MLYNIKDVSRKLTLTYLLLAVKSMEVNRGSHTAHYTRPKYVVYNFTILSLNYISTYKYVMYSNHLTIIPIP